MKKNFGPKTWLYPMPVLIVCAYDEHGVPCCMNAAWGGIYDNNQIIISLADGHKTTKNIIQTKAFTVNIADTSHVVECDYVGIVSGNNIPDKVSISGFTVSKSSFVNAPIINELPMAIECELFKFNEDGICIGNIVNVSADESVLADDGLIDHTKLHAITYDPVRHTYIELGNTVGYAFSDGKKLTDNE